MQKYYLQLKFSRVLMSFAIITIITIVCYFACFAYSEGTGNELLYNMARWPLYLVIYPAYLLSLIPQLKNGLFIFIGVPIGVILDSLLIELILIKYQKTK